VSDPITALLATTTVVTGSAAASVIMTAVTETGPDLAPWVQGGSAVIAVAALGYIARLLADGRLVARSSSQTEAGLVTVAQQLASLVQQSQHREDRLYEFLRNTHQSQGDGK
jgi:hypothetical protein